MNRKSINAAGLFICGVQVLSPDDKMASSLAQNAVRSSIYLMVALGWRSDMVLVRFCRNRYRSIWF